MPVSVAHSRLGLLVDLLHAYAWSYIITAFAVVAETVKKTANAVEAYSPTRERG